MKQNKTFILKKLSTAALAAAMVAAPAVNVFAAPEDVIDTSKTATLTIHKYDMTAATEGGVQLDQYSSNGKKNEAAEQALQKYAVEGVEFTYQKVGEICTESKAGSVQVMYEIPQELETILNLTDTRGDHKHTSDEINAAMKTILTDNTASKNKLENYMKKNSGTATSMPLTDAQGVSKATNLPLGLYLMVETKVPANVHTTVDPFFVSLPMTDVEGSAWFYDVDVYPKNQTNIPDLDKTVRQHDDAELYQKPDYTHSATASEGEKVDYLLVSHLPKITSEATYLTQYTFVDKIAKGFVYNKDAEIRFYDTAEDAQKDNKERAVATWTKESGNFKQLYNDTATDTATFEMTDEGLSAINPKLTDKWMVISYSATIDSNENPTLGETGNTNDATLTWKRTSMDFSDTLKARARVFSYGINLKKNFKKTSPEDAEPDATKVQFSLQNKTDGHFITARQETPGSGIYYVTDATKGDKEASGTVFSPASDGTLIINGLEADDYIMVELQTDKGYNLLKEPIDISIKTAVDEFTPSKTTLYDSDKKQNNPNKEVIETPGTRASATVDGNATEMISVQVTSGEGTQTDSTNAKVNMSVTNTPGFKLPATGGAGTIAFTVAGCTVAFAGIALVTKKSNKKKKEDSK